MKGINLHSFSVKKQTGWTIKENIAVATEINLDYKQNFALQFVGLIYTAPDQNQYAYKLEGFDKNWNYVGNSTTAAYTNLDPGGVPVSGKSQQQRPGMEQ